MFNRSKQTFPRRHWAPLTMSSKSDKTGRNLWNRCLKVMSSLKIYRPAKSLPVEVDKDHVFKGEAEDWINMKDLREGALLYGAGRSRDELARFHGTEALQSQEEYWV